MQGKKRIKTCLFEESGFTLLEMAVIVVISGIILTFLGSALLTFMRENQIETTEQRIAKIESALGRYLSDNGRYPCPANRFLGPGDSDFGKEVTTTCNSGGFSGTTRRGGVRIGAVPNRSLNLTEEDAADAWGRKFTYAVTENLATPQAYRSDEGRVRIRDDSGGVITDEAHYIVISHGVTGEGGLPLGAGNLPTIPCPTVNTRDRENCDHSNNIFRQTLTNPAPNLVDFYDDYVTFRGFRSSLAIPTGAVLPFETSTCPDGWTRFNRTEGQIPVAAVTSGGDAVCPAGASLCSYLTMGIAEDIVNPTITVDLSHGVRGRSPRAGIPRYLALTYCEKLPL